MVKFGKEAFEKCPFERLRRMLKDNIKIHIMEIDIKNGQCIDLAQGYVQ
jgi:hypothetical protein